MRTKRCEPGRLAGKANERLQDEVYRQMFRAEARVPAADLDLAMTLVRAWLAVQEEPANSDLRIWLAVVSPLCLQIIDSLRIHDEAQSRAN
jgi:hypothetical protein